MTSAHQGDLAELKDDFNKTDIIESCSQETINTERRFYKLKKVTLFAASLQEVPLGCREAV